MIQTKDNRKLFTHQKNYKHLLEYIKTFKAKVFIVNTDSDQKILDLNKLVPALCDKNYNIKNLNFEILEIKKDKIKIKRKI
jgi:hypothetical protein